MTNPNEENNQPSQIPDYLENENEDSKSESSFFFQNLKERFSGFSSYLNEFGSEIVYAASSPKSRLNLRNLFISILLIFLTRVSYLVYNELSTSKYIFESFSVPEDLEKNGYTGSVLARELSEEISLLNQKAHTSDPKLMINLRKSRDQFLEVEVIGIALPIQIFLDFIGQIFSIDNRIKIISSLKKFPNKYTLQIHQSGQPRILVTSESQNEEDAMNDLIQKACISFLKQNHPILLSDYLLQYGDDEDTNLSIEILKKFLFDEDEDRLNWIKTILARAYIRNNEFEPAEKLLNEINNTNFPAKEYTLGTLYTERAIYYSKKKFPGYETSNSLEYKKDIERSTEYRELALKQDYLPAFSGIAFNYQLLGLFKDSNKILDKAKNNYNYTNEFIYSTYAENYALLGDKNKFYYYLEKALELNAPIELYIDIEPYSSFKKEERFQNLLKRYPSHKPCLNKSKIN